MCQCGQQVVNFPNVSGGIKNGMLTHASIRFLHITIEQREKGPIHTEVPEPENSALLNLRRQKRERCDCVFCVCACKCVYVCVCVCVCVCACVRACVRA